MNFFIGKKTYISAGLLIIYALIGWYLKIVSPQMAIQSIFVALGLGSLRSAIAGK